MTLALLSTPQIKMIVTLIAVDVILGIVAAIVKKDFKIGKMAKFMGTPVWDMCWAFPSWKW